MHLAAAQADERQEPAYPPSLIRWFAGGVCTFGLGLLLLPLSFFAEAAPLDFAAATLLAAGASLVALTISRGQEMDESRA